MGLFGKDKFCKHCGKKVGMTMKVRLSDGNELCFDCTSDVPDYLMPYLKDVWTYDDFAEYKKYQEYSSKTLKPMFHETGSYEKLHMDEEHGLFYIGEGILDSLKANTLILEMKNLESFGLAYVAEEVNAGLFKDSVTGSIVFQFKTTTPNFQRNEIIEANVKAKVITGGAFKANVTYNEPLKFSLFRERFEQACYSHYANAHQESETDTMSGTSASELDAARTLFMYDSLEGVTEDDIKMQRNRLIKAFHPDGLGEMDAQFAQKINHAYEVLVAYIKKR